MRNGTGEGAPGPHLPFGTAAAVVVLIALTLAVYHPVAGFGFLNFDDNLYVTDNRNLASGLGRTSVAWAFTSVGYCGNWHPLTWLSHAIDIELFGFDPGAHHRVNLLFHLANGVLLFLVVRASTGALWRSAVVAALFAVHPLHVESVAWVAERKDLLSSCLWLLALGAYLGYARRPGLAAYLAVFLLFALGLMAKPMVVTLPLVLLLLDFWPLGRGRLRRSPRGNGAGAAAGVSWARLLVEKLPLLALSGLSGAVTVVAQRRGGALAALGQDRLLDRLPNVFVSYVRYAEQMLWPDGLAVFYPLVAVPRGRALLALALLALVTIGAALLAGRRPFLLAGWLWYVLTLAPVIGFVQVGAQSAADRYTYLPLIGLFALLAWGIESAVRRPQARVLAVALPVAAISALTAAARLQVERWRDTTTLFTHTLRVTSDNWLAHNVLGKELLGRGEPEAAIAEFRKSLSLRPTFALARNNLGLALFEQGLLAEAVAEYRAALRVEPDDPRYHTNLGNALDELDRPDEALAHYRAALRADPGAPEVYFNIGVLLENRGRPAEAEPYFRRCLALDPGFGLAHLHLGNVAVAQGRTQEAIAHYRNAVRVDPASAEAGERLRRLLQGAPGRP